MGLAGWFFWPNAGGIIVDIPKPQFMKHRTYSLSDMPEKDYERTVRVDDARLGTQKMKEDGSVLKQEKKKATIWLIIPLSFLPPL